MPYIPLGNRAPIEVRLREVVDLVGGAGELNFAVTYLVSHYLLNWAGTADRITYVEYNTVIGVLEAAKLEFYRRMVVPYEDEKKDENGDVY